MLSYTVWSPSYAAFFSNLELTFYKQISLCNSAYEDLQDMIDKGGEDYLKDYQYEIRACRAFLLLSCNKSFWQGTYYSFLRYQSGRRKAAKSYSSL